MYIYWERHKSTKKSAEAVIDTSKEVGLELNAKEIKYMLMSHH
jgi:hypothetical protein